MLSHISVILCTYSMSIETLTCLGINLDGILVHIFSGALVVLSAHSLLNEYLIYSICMVRPINYNRVLEYGNLLLHIVAGGANKLVITGNLKPKMFSLSLRCRDIYAFNRFHCIVINVIYDYSFILHYLASKYLLI